MPALMLIMALTVVSLQSPPPFDGNWIAEYRGATHVRLTLRTVDGVTSGTISLGDMEVDENGAIVKAAEAPKAMKAITDIRLRRNGAILAFVLKEGENPDQFEVAVVRGSLELTLVLSDEERREFAAEGIPIPKPIRLTRAK